MIALLVALQLADLLSYALVVAQHVPGRELGPLGALPLPLVVGAKCAGLALVLACCALYQPRAARQPHGPALIRSALVVAALVGALGVAANGLALT